MIAYVGIADARRNADHPDSAAEQCRFSYAEASPKGKNSACAVVCGVVEIDIGIVRNRRLRQTAQRRKTAPPALFAPTIVWFANAMTSGESLSMKVPGGEVSCYIKIHRIISNSPLYLIEEWPTSLDGRQGDGRAAVLEFDEDDFLILLRLP